MAYRPPSQTRYSAVTAPPPPGPFSSRSSRSSCPTSSTVQDNDGWITPSSRRQKYGEPVTSANKAPLTLETVAKTLNEEKEFPTLGTAPSLSKKTWGSSDSIAESMVESMAERMKKRIQEEEEEQFLKEQAKIRKEQNKQTYSNNEFVPTNIVYHQSLMRRFKEDEHNVYEEEELYEPGIDDDGYGYNYNYAEPVQAHTPEYSYENENYQDNNWDDRV